MKVALVGDIHVMDRPPAHAAETYLDDVIDHLKWVADYCSENSVPVCVWAGDVFHHKQPSRTSHALVLRMIEVVRYYEEREIELFIVTGNHDISNDWMASLHEKQPLGVLFAAGAQELVGWHKGYPIFGVPWQQDWTTNEEAPANALEGFRARYAKMGTLSPAAQKLLSERGGGRYGERALVVTHAPIYPPGEAEKQMFELVPTMGEHGLSAAMGNNGYLYYGHIHSYAGVFTVEGVTYCNVGAINRGTVDDYNLTRDIRMAVWSDENPVGFQEVVIPSRPVSEALKVAEVAEEKAVQLSLDHFLTEVGHSTLDITSTGSVIEHIRGRQDVAPRIKKKAIEILEQVE